ncbi:MAG: sulfotransferase [Alphaproteobacteria bacterium]|nr:sulfotransferase [Alphaproteobacteria bacterium]
MTLHKKPSQTKTVNMFAIMTKAVVLSFLAFLFLIHRLAFALDIILFPRLKKVSIDKPLFIVGLPRSGTTTAHRFMASHTELFTSMPLWELLFAPALCQKYLIWGLYRVDNAVGGLFFKVIKWIQMRLGTGLANIHPIDLTKPEEDYLGLLPFDGCFLRFLMFPFSKSTWDLGDFSSMTETRRKKLLTAYRGLVQRHLIFRGEDKRLLSKNPSFTTWVSDLAKTFPDAEFIGMHRDLEQTVPSQLSSIHSGLKIFGYSAKDPHIVKRFVMLLKLYQSRIKVDASNLGSRMLILDFRELVGTPDKAIEVLYGHFELPQRNNLDTIRLTDLMVETKAYKSKHFYKLQDFGLKSQDLIPSNTPPKLKNSSA